MALAIDTSDPAQNATAAKMDYDHKKALIAIAQDINNLWVTMQQVISTGTGISGTALPATPSFTKKP